MKKVLQILYVEDEPDIRAVTELALEDEGFELISCASGREALDKAPGLKPDLILLDVMMPDIDGPTTLSKLRELPHLTDTPVIFMTAKVQASEVEQYKAMTALGVIGKPFDAMTLAGDIRAILERSGGR
ncbi:MAG: response regulator [Gammaproteobacteria bacterium]|nr:response regulator [Gammaproteobacteria bacterium]